MIKSPVVALVANVMTRMTIEKNQATFEIIAKADRSRPRIENE